MNKDGFRRDKAYKGAYRTRTVWLNSSQLVSSPRIQRSLSTSRVNRIAQNFDPLVVNPIKVSKRGGKYYVFDGQHTLAAIKQVNNGEDVDVECRIYEGIDYEKEAHLFATQFGFSERVSKIYRLRALAEAKDESVLDFLATTRNVGYKIDLACHKSCNGRIVAVCAAYDAYEELSNRRYARMLDIVLKTWGGVPWSVTKNMINGMTVFFGMYEKIDTRRFISRMRRLTASDIRNKALEYKGRAIGSAYGVAIADFYEGK